jgi:DNA-binding transcriptional ArsR family regulator
MIPKEVFELQSRLCHAMSNPDRLEIIHILREGPQHVGSLVNLMGVSQTAMSRHLAVLRNIGLVSVHRQGQENIYQLTNQRVGDICDMMRQLLAEQLIHQAEVATKLEKHD